MFKCLFEWASQDGESGWSSLHRALHFGHLAVASILIQSGASTTVEDSKYRTPVDLLSGPVSQAVGNEDSSGILQFLKLLTSTPCFLSEWKHQIGLYIKGAHIPFIWSKIEC